MPSLVERLCENENPVVAYRARRLLAGESGGSRPMRKLRSAIGSSAMARQLLTALRRRPLNPYIKWQGPHWTLYSLAEIELPPQQRAILPLRDRVLDWLLDPRFLKPPTTVFYQGQPTRPRRHASMEGNAVWSQLRLDIVDRERTPRLVERLLQFQWPDGGWNCDTREPARTSSVQETLIPLRALTAWWKATGDSSAHVAAQRAAEFLLARRLLWRRRDGGLITPKWGGPVDKVHYPIRFYDVLTALLAMTELGVVRDERCAAALDLLEGKALADGMFPVEWTNVRTTDRLVGRGTFADWGPRGRKEGNPFVTIDALYVLREAGRDRSEAMISTASRSSGTRRAGSKSDDLRQLLSGGDRRSVAGSERARALIMASPKRIAELASLADDQDWLVSMRALDLLEKLAHERADWVQPFRKLFIGPLADSDKWELRLQVVRALPLLSWTPRERARVIEILRRDIAHPQKFVRAWALDGLATLAGSDRALQPVIHRAIEEAERSGSKALQVRARQIRERL